MPTYILLSTLTPEGRQTLHKDPDRMEQVNKEIAEFGCTVISQYAVLGPIRFRDHRRGRRQRDGSSPVGRSRIAGTVNIMTLPAIPVAELRAKMKGPKQMGRT
jgi:uncharacterized protein with GYD domain